MVVAASRVVMRTFDCAGDSSVVDEEACRIESELVLEFRELVEPGAPLDEPGATARCCLASVELSNDSVLLPIKDGEEECIDKPKVVSVAEVGAVRAGFELESGLWAFLRDPRSGTSPFSLVLPSNNLPKKIPIFLETDAERPRILGPSTSF